MASNIDFKLRADADEVVIEAKKAEKALGRINKRLKKNEERADRTRKSFSRLLKGGLAVGAVTGAANLISNHVGKMVSAFVDYEKALVSVGKTTGISGKALKMFGEDLKKLAERMGVANKELLETAQTAGQLGISGREELISFVEVMTELAEASDLTAEGAASAVKVIQNLLNLDTGSARRLADILVNLGNNLPATESQILTVATKISQAIGQFGVGEQAVFALAGAFKSVGVEAEIASSTSLVVLQNVKKLAREGGPELDTLAEMFNTTSENLITKLKGNVDDFILYFIKKLGELNEGEFAQASQILGAEGRQLSRGLGSLVTGEKNQGILSESYELAGVGSAGASAAEGATARATLGRDIQAIKEKYNAAYLDLAESTTNIFLGPFEALVDSFTVGAEAVKNFNENFDKSFIGVLMRRVFDDSYTRIEGRRQGDSESLIDLKLHINSLNDSIDQYEGRIASAFAGKTGEDPEALKEQQDNVMAVLKIAERQLKTAQILKEYAPIDPTASGSKKKIADDDDDDVKETDAEKQARLLREAQEKKEMQARLLAEAAARVEINRGYARMFDAVYEDARATAEDIAKLFRENQDDLYAANDRAYPQDMIGDRGMNDPGHLMRMEEAMSGYQGRDTEALKQWVADSAAAVEKIKKQYEQLGDAWANTVADPIRALFRGEDFGDALGNALLRLRDEMIEMTIIEPIMERIRESFKKTGDEVNATSKQVQDLVASTQGGAGGGLLGGILGSLSKGIGGGGLGGLFSAAGSFFGGFFEDGGRMPRTGYAVVGERGPEFVKLPGGAEVFKSGTMPSEMGGGGSINITNQLIFQGVGGDEDSINRVIDSRLPDIEQATRNALTADARNGNTAFGRALRR